MTCEECWRDAAMQVMLSGGSQVDRYSELLQERKNDTAHIARNTPGCPCDDDKPDPCPKCGASVAAGVCKYPKPVRASGVSLVLTDKETGAVIA